MGRLHLLYLLNVYAIVYKRGGKDTEGDYVTSYKAIQCRQRMPTAISIQIKCVSVANL